MIKLFVDENTSSAFGTTGKMNMSPRFDKKIDKTTKVGKKELARGSTNIRWLLKASGSFNEKFTGIWILMEWPPRRNWCGPAWDLTVAWRYETNLLSALSSWTQNCTTWKRMKSPRCESWESSSWLKASRNHLFSSPHKSMARLDSVFALETSGQ